MIGKIRTISMINNNMNQKHVISIMIGMIRDTCDKINE